MDNQLTNVLLKPLSQRPYSLWNHKTRDSKMSNKGEQEHIKTCTPLHYRHILQTSQVPVCTN